MIPTINVNMRPCDCGYIRGGLKTNGGHGEPCAGTPVLIPCPIPRSVTFEVVLGGCTMPVACSVVNTHGQVKVIHLRSCPARPIRVTCTISGKTWEECEVTDAWTDREDGYLCSTAEEFPTLLPICRERWALVKALVLGLEHARVVSVGADTDEIERLCVQRDVVFSALADMARAQAVVFERLDGLPSGIRPVLPGGARECPPHVEALFRYVEHLIEQVSHVR